MKFLNMRMTMRIKLLIILIIFASFYIEAKNKPVLQVKGTGKASLQITPKSRAREMAFRAAQLECYKQMAAAAGFSQTYQSGNRQFIKVEAFLTGAQVIAKRYITDYEVEVTMEIPKTGLIKQIAILKKQQIAEVKSNISDIEKQIFQLNQKLLDLKGILKKLEENTHEET
jgi:hypothetical protein